MVLAVLLLELRRLLGQGYLLLHTQAGAVKLGELQEETQRPLSGGRLCCLGASLILAVIQISMNTNISVFSFCISRQRNQFFKSI